tara:strand:- start:154 stop:1086 length:933 start_codon:yes stop_codon:yes gene_type:complete
MAAPRTKESNINQPLPQVRNIADVKANLLRPALTSQFEVYIPLHKIPIRAMNAAGIFLNKNNEWMLNLSCSNASLPGSKLLTSNIKNDRTGVTEYHVHRRMYDETIDFEFYVPAENYIPIRIFECWMDYAAGVELEDERKDTISSNYFYRMNYPDDYIADQGLKIRKFERDFTESEANIAGGYLEYEFIRAFPVAVNSMPVTYDASELLKVTVQFSYIRYVMNKGWFKQINEDPASVVLGVGGAIVQGKFGEAWEMIKGANIHGALQQAAMNSLSTLTSFVFGQDSVDKIRGGARWVNDTLGWIRGLGRR